MSNKLTHKLLRFTARLCQTNWHTNSHISQPGCVSNTQTPTFHSLAVSNKLTHKLLHFTAWLCQTNWHTNSYISQPGCVSNTQTPTLKSQKYHCVRDFIFLSHIKNLEQLLKCWLKCFLPLTFMHKDISVVNISFAVFPASFFYWQVHLSVTNNVPFFWCSHQSFKQMCVLSVFFFVAYLFAVHLFTVHLFTMYLFSVTMEACRDCPGKCQAQVKMTQSTGTCCVNQLVRGKCQAQVKSRWHKAQAPAVWIS